MMAEGVDTPTAILANAAAALREHPFDDISYRTLGDAVGVSERTVYRHFPTRSHLLEGVAGWIESTEFPLPPFVTIPSVPGGGARSVPGLRFVAGVRVRVCARGIHLTHWRAGAHLLHPSTGRRCSPRITRSVNERDLRRVAATLRYFASAQFWARMRTGFEMSAPAIADVFDRTVAEVLRDLLILSDAEMHSAPRRASG